MASIANGAADDSFTDDSIDLGALSLIGPDQQRTGQPTSASPPGEAPLRDVMFFRVIHTRVGAHKVAHKGTATYTDIAIQPLKVLQVSGAGANQVVRLDINSAVVGQLGLASWLTDCNISAEQLMSSMKQWTIMQDRLWRVDLSQYRAALLSRPTPPSFELCEQIVASCIASKAWGDSVHTYCPNLSDADVMSAVTSLAEAGLLVGMRDAHLFRLGRAALHAISQQLALHVQKPFLFFSSRAGVPLEELSLLELLIDIENKGWNTFEADVRKPPPHVRGGDKLWHRSAGNVPFKHYMICLLKASHLFDSGLLQLHHKQCCAYYTALLRLVPSWLPSVLPNQPAQYYKAFLSRAEGVFPQENILEDDSNLPLNRRHVCVLLLSSLMHVCLVKVILHVWPC
jgi:hypothetical protein